ncbi:uncharacterized protein At1g65710-like [Rosa rugosa]|uniref:uncharacterized protein At1g65710-like n=1 Tax=Rosa rugosa TaxID=74645 RepID=UPI002B413301|nr:uncharacterized protein At1g65710-like [Rosa rugosa]
MGSCFSKKKGSSPPAVAADYVATSSAPAVLAVADPKSKPSVPGKQEQIEEESKVKKEIFIIKHRKSHDDRDRPLPLQQNLPQKADASAPITTAATTSSSSTTTTENCNQVSMDDRKAAEASTGTGVRVRTSSCNKEEVDAILIQCGRLSRSSSGKAASSSSASCDRGKKYSGSKRSYDFDNCENDYQVAATCEDAKNNDDFSDEKTHHHRQRHRQSSRHSPSSQGRRRTPSRERNQQQRSSSRERRTSRSPGRRLSLEQNNTNCNANTTTAATANVNSDTNQPGKMKMVSVPATVSVVDKNSNGESATTGSIKRISVKRNAGEAVNVVVGSRTAASPRSQSPARGGANAKASNDSLQQQPSLSRSSSRKAEQSPYRRNPLSELDPNSLAYPQAHINNSNNKSASNVVNQLKPNVEINSNKIVAQGINYRSSTASSAMDNKVVEPAGASGPHTLTRSRSSRRSRDLDINPETLSNPPPSYTRLLLEDIQNFHQQSSNAAVVSLPQCVTKACSILEAVADLNSTTNFSADRKSPSIDQINKSSCYYNSSLGTNLVQGKDIPFVESEVLVDDDLLEPSFHKYVTVRRGGADMEDQESSGSNSFVSGSQQPQWGFSSSWEPNSADSTDCWSSRSNTREDDQNFDMDEAARRRLSRRKTDRHNMQSGSGIGRGKLVAGSRGLHTMPVVAAAAST